MERLGSGSVYFSGEESAGSSFLRQDGTVWTTDKEGIIAGLLAAKITVVTGKTPDGLFEQFTEQAGQTYYARIDSPAQAEVRSMLGKILAEDVHGKFDGDDITNKLTRAPGNGAPIGGIKLVTANGWVAARSSGTEDIIKIYAESFQSPDRLTMLQSDSRALLSL